MYPIGASSRLLSFGSTASRIANRAKQRHCRGTRRACAAEGSASIERTKDSSALFAMVRPSGVESNVSREVTLSQP